MSPAGKPGPPTPQTAPRVSWLQTARQDLVEAYDALGRSGEAARYRAELADSASASS